MGGVRAAGAFEEGPDDAVGGAVQDQVEGVHVEGGKTAGDVGDNGLDAGGMRGDLIEAGGQDIGLGVADVGVGVGLAGGDAGVHE